MDVNLVNQVNGMSQDAQSAAIAHQQELQRHHEQLQHHQLQLQRQQQLHQQQQQQHQQQHQLQQQQQHHLLQIPGGGHIQADRNPELLLPVASTSSTDVIDESETIIKAANKAGYNVKRHLDALTFAKDIVERYKERGNVLPKEWSSTNSDPAREQEYKDAGKLRKWKQALRGSYRGNICAKEIREYLDEHMPAWRIDRKVKFRPAMQFAQEIVERYQQRGGVLPRFVKDRSDPTKIQEFKDAQKLKGLKQGLLGVRKEKCSDEVRDFLDKHMPTWRDKSVQPMVLAPGAEKPTPKNMDPLEKARGIVARYHERGDVLPKEWSDRRGDPAREQEYKDAGKLRKWRQALKGIRSVSSICPDNVRDYLDKEMPSWRSDMNRHRKKSKGSENDHGSGSNGSGHAAQSLAAAISNEVVIGVQVDRMLSVGVNGGESAHSGHNQNHNQNLGHQHQHQHGHSHVHHMSSGEMSEKEVHKRSREEFEKAMDDVHDGHEDKRMSNEDEEEVDPMHRLIAESADI